MATLTACRIVWFANISSFGLRVLEDGRPYVEEIELQYVQFVT